MDFIDLVRRRYPNWEDASHADFVRDELEPKQKLVAQAAESISQTAVDELLAAGEHEELLTRLERLAQRTNLLWRQVPLKGDTAVFQPSLRDQIDSPTLAAQFRNLLYGDRSTPDRLQTFSDYLTAQELPNKWPLPTFLLFVTQPEQEIFVRPRPMSWFLKFMGEQSKVSGAPDGTTYAQIQKHALALRQRLAKYGINDMLGVQSIIWIGARESRERVKNLTTEAQIALDVPKSVPTEIEVAEDESETAVMPTLQESPSTYQAHPEQQPAYPLADIAAQTGHEEATLAQWVAAIERKKQAIFYGPPGTGKTFVADQLARHLAGGGDGFVELVQFHPAYAYEDFVQGIRPLSDANGALRYELVNGRFLTFCERARQRTGRCVLIIDEINRANLAAVFGELMYLLEYRDRAIPLAAGGRPFAIPDNVRLIGTMNTADRSIALVDHALRRRFAFIHLPPNYAILRHYHAQTGYDVAGLTAVLRRLNEQIDDPHYQLGFTFFLHPNLSEQLPSIWQMEIEPYLEEYFFDQPDLVDRFRWAQIGNDLSSESV